MYLMRLSVNECVNTYGWSRRPWTCSQRPSHCRVCCRLHEGRPTPWPPPLGTQRRRRWSVGEKRRWWVKAQALWWNPSREKKPFAPSLSRKIQWEGKGKWGLWVEELVLNWLWAVWMPLIRGRGERRSCTVKRVSCGWG